MTNFDPFEMRLRRQLRSRSYSYEQTLEAYWCEQWQELVEMTPEAIAALYAEQRANISAARTLPGVLRNLRVARPLSQSFLPWQPAGDNPWQRAILVSFVGSITLHALLMALKLPVPEAPPLPTAPKVLLVESAPSPKIAPKPLPPKSEPRPHIVRTDVPQKAKASRPILSTKATTPSESTLSEKALAGSRGTGFGREVGNDNGSASPIGVDDGTGSVTPVEAPPAPPPLVNARPKGAVQPDYPEIALQNNWEGKVIVKAYINADGSVGEVRVARSSGHDELDEAALEAVRRTRFEPAHRSEEAVATWVRVPITFSLD
ncbi:energy transducer TonB [Gloeobacter kilaueensis]|uniref:TonB family protein n=1 Tax=Gloeobacter kilaueensis (strain ATCC BAA-2537 / CCAP 1431/1 / ULC 316 / JS1) TaxID=1183438 RepID=U5QGT5_GLOK1|nr:energy transducer TonB [Gloeobacter kilaueensis]AGY56809.1 TonB family protein [Gloeobacter kilaueensis JS1]